MVNLFAPVVTLGKLGLVQVADYPFPLLINCYFTCATLFVGLSTFPIEEKLLSLSRNNHILSRFRKIKRFFH